MGKKVAALLLAGLLGLAVTSPAGELSVLPPPAWQLPQEGCGDVLQQAGLVLPGLEFLVCRREGQPAREVARYRVRGDQAAAVEALLREKTGMAALERVLGMWTLPAGGEGRLPASAGRTGRVFMGEVPLTAALAAERSQWAQIAWFAVRVELDH